ncbi:hypothetical protein Fmac_024992 [Flemingia macrophylla]|uniref:Uncharacterized protein n=1 Tax=Flemingia macrophylla TaxID=520843 RepID=A0ABD1LQY6_9FABA
MVGRPNNWRYCIIYLVLNLVVDALSHEDANVRTAACICLRSVSHSIKVCNMR